MNKTTKEINELKKIKMHESIAIKKLYATRVPGGLWYMFDNRSIFVPFDDFEEKYKSEKENISNEYKRDLDIE